MWALHRLALALVCQAGFLKPVLGSQAFPKTRSLFLMAASHSCPGNVLMLSPTATGPGAQQEIPYQGSVSYKLFLLQATYNCFFLRENGIPRLQGGGWGTKGHKTSKSAKGGRALGTLSIMSIYINKKSCMKRKEKQVLNSFKK